MKLTLNDLIEEAVAFSEYESNILHQKMLGINDGKAIGTYIEHKFKKYLNKKYKINIGSSSKGIDLPDSFINTDIKVTSIKHPQSSSPFKNIEQKVYGLGHNLLIFIYEKIDVKNRCYIDFKQCIFLEAEKTGDYLLTKKLIELCEKGTNENEIIDVLIKKNVPGDEQNLKNLAKKILLKTPKQGYLTISNAFQWRLKYNNILNLNKDVFGIYNYQKYSETELKNYQTPLFFTDMICEYLKNDLNISPDIIIEPTCGIGNFLKSTSKFFPNKFQYGIDIDKTKLDKIDKQIPNCKLINEDIFSLKFNKIEKDKSYLIIGNPPWIKNEKISKVYTKKNPNYNNSNSKSKLTSDNEYLDISESIILKMINTFKNTQSTIAVLCKTTVSRNIFLKLIKNNVKYSLIKQINLNSKKIFNINVDSCLLIIQFCSKNLNETACKVSDISNPNKILYEIIPPTKNNSNNNYQIDGTFPLEWKQGVKHDCAKIMELTCHNHKLINKKGNEVFIETTFLYPLIKSGDLKKPIINTTSKYIIITQKNIKQNTRHIQSKAPKTWAYLTDNQKYFDDRKSAIYKNTPKFSIGIDESSFKKYKIAISGFGKNPNFSLIYNKKPIMVSDTCYYISLDNYDSAYITLLILNSELVKKFLKKIAVIKSKRPFTKKILKRIDIGKCLNILSLNDLKKIERKLGLTPYITNEKLKKYENSYWKL